MQITTLSRTTLTCLFSPTRLYEKCLEKREGGSETWTRAVLKGGRRGEGAGGEGWGRGPTGMFDQVLIYLRFEAPGVILRRCENVFIAWGKKALQILAVQYIFDMKAGRIAASRGTRSRMGPAGGVGDGDGYGCWDKSRPLSAATSTTCRHGIPAVFLIS